MVHIQHSKWLGDRGSQLLPLDRRDSILYSRTGTHRVHVCRKLGFDPYITVHHLLGGDGREGDLVRLYAPWHDGPGHSFHSKPLPLPATFRRISRCGLVRCSCLFAASRSLLDTASFFSQLVILSLCSTAFLRTLVASPKPEKRSSCAIQKVRCVAFGHGAPLSHDCGTGVLRSPDIRREYLFRHFSFFFIPNFLSGPEWQIPVPAWRIYLHPIEFPLDTQGESPCTTSTLPMPLVSLSK